MRLLSCVQPFVIVLILLRLNCPSALHGERSSHGYSNSWAVHISNGDDEKANKIAKRHGMVNLGQVSVIHQPMLSHNAIHKRVYTQYVRMNRVSICMTLPFNSSLSRSDRWKGYTTFNTLLTRDEWDGKSLSEHRGSLENLRLYIVIELRFIAWTKPVGFKNIMCPLSFVG